MQQTIKVRGRHVDFSSPMVMGILNVTPDSFYASSRYVGEHAVIGRAKEIVLQGGAIIDVGACSTRPGSEPVDEAEESRRLKAALTAIRREMPDVLLSVDTFRPSVARRAVEEWGADMVNDVTEGTGTDDGGETMFGCVGKMKVPYILTSVEPDVKAMVKRFRKELAELQALGAEDVILDPGFGFGKTLEENYRLLADMEKLKTLKRPILVGVSRKSMIYKALGITPDEALNGTTVLNTMALMKGANILRVHDVQEAVEAVNIFKLPTIKD